MTIVGDNITLTAKELNDVVANAVTNALQQLVPNVVIKDDTSNPENKIEVKSFTDEQYKDAMHTMEVNRGHGDEPKVGIFWYNIAQNELFGVVSHKISDYSKPNAGGGFITCSEMHEDVWKKAFNKQKYHGGTGPFIGAYQDKPRGRIFYSPATGRYSIAVGKWFDHHQEAYDLIMDEFDLPEDKTDVTYGEHWDIGQTWM